LIFLFGFFSQNSLPDHLAWPGMTGSFHLASRLLIVGLLIGNKGVFGGFAGGGTALLRQNKQTADGLARIDVGDKLGWLAQHMQWDFDDIDPYMPLSPYWRFDHHIKSKYLLPLGRETVRFSTTVRPTGRRGWVTTSVNPFEWLQMQATALSQGLKAPVLVASAEAKLPLDVVTQKTDEILNRGFEGMQQGLVGRTVAGGLHTELLVGVGTREEPWVGVQTSLRLLLSEKARPMRLRTRITCDRDYKVRAGPMPICSARACT
jgi:hypothetical protein